MNNFIVVRDRNMASVKEGFVRRIYFNVPKWSTITDKLFNPCMRCIYYNVLLTMEFEIQCTLL